MGFLDRSARSNNDLIDNDHATCEVDYDKLLEILFVNDDESSIKIETLKMQHEITLEEVKLILECFAKGDMPRTKRLAAIGTLIMKRIEYLAENDKLFSKNK